MGLILVWFKTICCFSLGRFRQLEAFTRAIATTLGLENAQAEEYKNTYGFSKEQMEGKLSEAMQPVLKSITDEIKKTVDFYTSKHQGESVKYVVLSGGVAALPNIVNQLSVQLGLEVSVGDPFSRVEIDEAQKQAVGNTAPFILSVSVWPCVKYDQFTAQERRNKYRKYC